MTQDERRLYLIQELMKENSRYKNIEIPGKREQQWRLLRSLMNVRPPRPVSEEFLKIQDAYLQELIAGRGIVDADKLESVPSDPRLVIWKGDITTLKIDAIVNAANSRMEGCWQPCHDCIDNCIHTYSGIQLRLYCHEMMVKQGHPEPAGRAKITPGFNLPAKYILHTVGPVIDHPLTQQDCDLLASCYEACLKLAAEYHCRSIAFCCISTGVFRFPKEKAAEIAVAQVKKFLEQDSTIKRAVFNVFTSTDESIYRIFAGLVRKEIAAAGK